jgi:hypothetical protein
VAGSIEVSMKRFGLGPMTVPDIESVQVHVMGAAIMVQGSSENELDFPWHLRASSTNIQRWLSLGAALVLGEQQLLAELQQEVFFAEVSATKEVLLGLFKIA